MGQQPSITAWPCEAEKAGAGDGRACVCVWWCLPACVLVGATKALLILARARCPGPLTRLASRPGLLTGPVGFSTGANPWLEGPACTQWEGKPAAREDAPPVAELLLHQTAWINRDPAQVGVLFSLWGWPHAAGARSVTCYRLHHLLLADEQQ